MRLCLSLFVLFATALTGFAVSAAPAEVPLTETRWVLSSIAGSAPETGRRETFLVFKADGGVAGHTGCNALGAVYTQADNALSFSPVMTTRMYCQEVARTEQALLVAMDDTRGVVVEGDVLQLVAGDGAILATFQATESPDNPTD